MRLRRKLRSCFLLLGLSGALLYPLAADIQRQYVPTRELALQRYLDMQRLQLDTMPDRVTVSRFEKTVQSDVYNVWLLVNQKEQPAPIQVRLQQSAFGYKPVLARVDLKWLLQRTKRTPWI
ncbi:hypothetical protein [Ectobacillus ponti]|uniref:DUF3888 domain-containing protein n=1 Tax=Ectobacillus ponti TaxID=2961894 RepID=A0AA42BND3_9BACI|nr:hypothetical protein [Ectobacillus ponti]MCP8967542.1 hypothetical protein [Ectobacillus ponti]